MVELQNQQKKLQINEEVVLKIAHEISKLLNVEDYEISVILVSDATMKMYNLDFRGIDKPTNVLSFPQHEGEEMPEVVKVLGDIVISVETARKEAALEHGIPESDVTEKQFLTRIAQLLIHGMLHLTGTHHDTEEKYEVMEKKSIEIFENIKKIIESI